SADPQRLAAGSAATMGPKGRTSGNQPSSFIKDNLSAIEDGGKGGESRGCITSELSCWDRVPSAVVCRPKDDGGHETDDSPQRRARDRAAPGREQRPSHGARRVVSSDL